MDLLFHHILLHIHETLLSPLMCRCNARSYILLRLLKIITRARWIPQYALNKVTNDLPKTDLGHDQF